MPNWKKVVTSGSNAELNALTMSGNIVPDTDNTLSIGASDNRFLLNGGTPVTVTGSGTANTLTRFQGATTVEDSKITSTDTQTIIEHNNSGNSIFIVSGANGQMLSISDEVGEKLFTVNNSSGLEVFSVSASGNLLMPNLTYSDTDYILSYASSSGVVTFVSASSVLPDNVVSGSAQTVANLSNQDVDLGTGDLTATDITSTNFTINDTLTAPTITGSLLRLSENGTGLRLTNVGGFEPTGSNVFNIFGNNNVIFKAGGSGDIHKVLTLNETSKDVEVENAVSASEFSGSFHGDGSGLTGVSADGTLSGSAQIASDISGSLSNTAIAALGAGIFSGSGQLPSGTVSGSAQTIANLPSGTVSGSAQTIANLPSGTISGSAQLPDGLISGSSQQPTIIVDRIEHIDDDNTAISFTPDQMYFSSSGQVGMTIGGAGGITVNPDGVNSYNFTIKGENVDHLFSAPNYQADRIGMNTQYPSHLLHVSGTARTHTLIVDERIEHHDDSDTGIKFTPNSMFFSSSGVVGMHIGGAGGVVINPDSTNSGKLTVKGETLPHLLSVGGNVDKIGINTQDPSHLLHVSGTARAASIVVDGEIMHHDDTNTRLSFSSSQMDFIQNSIHSLTLGGTVVVNPDRNNASDFYVYSQTSGETILDVNVGDTSITFHDAYKFPSADGTANQVLKTDGSGTLSFGDAGGDFTTLTNVPSGLVSGSAQTIANLPSGTISGSSQLNSTRLNLTDASGSFSGSFVGDGSGLTGVSTNLTEEVTVSQTFTSATTASVSHNFGTKDVIVTVYDNNDDLFVPTRVNTPDTNTAVVYMDPATTGRVVVAKGGHLVSGSIYKELVTGVTTKNITHNLQEEFPVVQLYESASRETFIPDTIKSIDENTTQIVLQSAIDCYVVIKR